MYLDHQHSQHQLSQTTLNKKNTLFRHKMEAVGAICEGEWSSSFNGMGSDEADFMAQLLGNCSLPNAAAFWGGDESEVKDVGVEETNTTSTFSFSLGNSMVFPSSSQWSYYPFLNNNSLMAMDLCMMDGKNNAMEGDDFLNQDASNDSIVSDDKLPHPLQEDKMSSKKRPRVLGESQRSKKLRKSVKVDENENENDDSNNASSTTTATKVMFHRQSSSSFCSEDESNASHEANGVNSSGKTQASRGSAIDPQSLYARKRRERINERLKVLQSLVPNGTKVDISTMLEEAVQYVKFLQLQIKLLSSDDMWMYAPIAYNGMDIGLDFKIPSPKSQT